MKSVLFLSICLILAIPCQAEIIIVDANGSGDYLTIQAAINDANNGDVIIVEPNIYTGPGNRDIDFNSLAITVRSTNPNDPDIVAATIIDCNGTKAEPHRGFYFHSGEDVNSVLAGLTIANGYAATGGAIFCENSSPAITNCAIVQNHAENGGGLATQDSANPTLMNCVIVANTCTGTGGGGIDCNNSAPTVTNCTIMDNNSTTGSAGGIRCTGSSNPTITNCVFWADSPNEISLENGASASITYCDVQGGWPGEGNIDADPLFAETVTDLIAYWKFDEGSGAIAYDTGGDNHGNLVGNPTWVAGKVGTYALDFDGDGDYVNLDSHIPNIEGLDQGTIAGWFKSSENKTHFIFTITQGSSNSDAFQVILGPATGAYDDEGFGFVLRRGGSNKLIMYVRNGEYAYTDGEWHHFAVCTGGGDNRIYIDGANQSVTFHVGGSLLHEFSNISNPTSMKIGVRRRNNIYEGYLDGTLDDVRIYDRPLSAEETQLLYQNCLITYVGYHLQQGSPCIDAGDPNGSYLGQVDIDGEPRVINHRVDIGADEYPGPFERYVPSQYSTIQAAIDDSNEGDVIIVEPNTYTGPGNRDIDFKGLAITVRGQNGPGNCIIDCNGAEVDQHRGFYFHSNEDVNSVLEGFTIINGYADNGGAIWCSGSGPTIRNCIINGNHANSNGGAIYNDPNSSPTLINSIISGNYANSNGGGIYNDPNSNLTITNCTISGNIPGANGGGMYCGLNSSSVITNCIMWGDSNSEIDVNNATLTTTFSDVQGGWPGVGNIDVDPCFADPLNGDYHLQSSAGRWDPNSQTWVTDINTSPCIDAGDPNSDWSQEPQPNGYRINMGAFGGTSQASKTPCYWGPDLDEWVAVGAPYSWCCDTQCHADADCAREWVGRRMFEVGFDDIHILLEGFLEAYGGDPAVDTWIAADFDHAAEAVGRTSFRVGFNDIDVLLTYFLEVSIPTDCQTDSPVSP